jgi:predicted adenylyl cyclase CyaB
MAANIEIKAYARNFESLREKAEELSDKPCQIIPQVDTFFTCPHGRFKLRELSPEHAQLVYYQRPDVGGPKHSEYQIYETTDPLGLKNILAQAYGIRGVVSKVRYLYLVGQTRIHLDDVQDLGKFVELEVVLRPGQSDSDGQAIAEDLIGKLGIQPGDLIEGAYMDMLEE